MNDLDQMSEDELRDLIKRAEKAIKSRIIGRRNEVQAQIEALASSIDMSVQLREVAKGKRKMDKAPPKYKNPDDWSQTWNGRGPRPKWFRAQLESGRTADDLAI